MFILGIESIKGINFFCLNLKTYLTLAENVDLKIVELYEKLMDWIQIQSQIDKYPEIKHDFKN